MIAMVLGYLALGDSLLSLTPNSGTDREKAARLNLLNHAGDDSGRLFEGARFNRLKPSKYELAFHG